MRIPRLEWDLLPRLPARCTEDGPCAACARDDGAICEMSTGAAIRRFWVLLVWRELVMDAWARHLANAVTSSAMWRRRTPTET